jgi:MoxR-like ATPase
MNTQIFLDVDNLQAKIGNLVIHLAKPYEIQSSETEYFLGDHVAAAQLEAAWLRLSMDDAPMNPRIVGKPGVGKTTLALWVAQNKMNLPVYFMQGTSDTRPDDLILTPVLTEVKRITYVASPLLTALLLGGVCILDEGNRMSEKSWASLAPLLDHRRYVDSLTTGTRLHAHKEFRFVTTMNDDASVYDLPEYIQSRLNPQIYLDFADAETEARIVKLAVPYVESELLALLTFFLNLAHRHQESYCVRDGIQIAKYAQRLRVLNKNLSLFQALQNSVSAVLGDDALKYFPTEDDVQGQCERSHLRPL